MSKRNNHDSKHNVSEAPAKHHKDKEEHGSHNKHGSKQPPPAAAAAASPATRNPSEPDPNKSSKRPASLAAGAGTSAVDNSGSATPAEIDEIAQRLATKAHVEFDTKRRYISRVVRASAVRLSMDQIYTPAKPGGPGGDKPNYDVIRKHFELEGRLEEQVAIRIARQAYDIMAKEPNVLLLDAPITICGDLHGQFYDLIKLFEVTGYPPDARLLFLGDYVDRGQFGTEVVLLLFALKINYPQSIFLLRGNHECRHLTAFFTFQEECLVKYTEAFWNESCRTFDSLPLAAIAAKQFFCIHGGLSPNIMTVDEIGAVDRFMEPPTAGPLCDLVWADPTENYGEESPDADMFKPNPMRGCSFTFSYKAVCTFLRHNKLLCLIRAHEVQQLGYKMYKASPHTKFPSLITLFSAPNYLDMYNNKAAVMFYDGKTMNLKQFSHVKHPFWLPNFMDVFAWSLPFVAEKMLQMLTSVVGLLAGGADSAESGGNASASEDDNEQIRAKTEAMKKMVDMFHSLQEQSTTLIKLRGLAPTEADVLLTEKDDLVHHTNSLSTLMPNLSGGENAEAKFSRTREADLRNERLPPTRHEAIHAEGGASSGRDSKH